MSGTIDVCDLSSAEVRQNSDQTSLYQHSDENDESYVSIVRRQNNSMEEATDYRDVLLAPSDELLDDWLEEKERLKSEEGMSNKDAHNRAFRLVRYRKRYLEEVDDAVFDSYAEQIKNGFCPVFVCYCSNGHFCHRHIVKEKIHERLNE